MSYADSGSAVEIELAPLFLGQEIIQMVMDSHRQHPGSLELNREVATISASYWSVPSPQKEAEEHEQLMLSALLSSSLTNIKHQGYTKYFAETKAAQRALSLISAPTRQQISVIQSL